MKKFLSNDEVRQGLRLLRLRRMIDEDCDSIVDLETSSAAL